MNFKSRGKSAVAACLGLTCVAIFAFAFHGRQNRAAHVISPGVTNSHALSSFQLTSMGFEPNQGQTDPQVKYIAREKGYSLFLTSNEAVMAIASRERKGRKVAPGAVVQMRMLGSNPSSSITPTGKLPGVVNYFRGRDASKWQRGVPRYERVQYHNLYPGVDLAFHGQQGQTEFDFTVAPNTDASAIRLAFTEAKPRLDEKGNLVLASAAGDITLHAPVAYQEMNGTRRDVETHYLVDSGDVRIRVRGNDPDRQLIIASSLIPEERPESRRSVAASTKEGLSGFLAIGVLPVIGFVLVGAVGPVRRRKAVTAITSCSAVFLIALTIACGGGNGGSGGGGGGNGGGGGGGGSTAGTLTFARYLGGIGDDKGLAITADGSGNTYITGEAGDATFPAVPANQIFAGGAHDAFVAKLDSSNNLVYATLIGGTSDDAGTGITVDALGNAFVTGNTQFGSSFPANLVSGLGTGGGADVFVAGLDPTGALFMSSAFGGVGTDAADGIALDPSGNIYIAGETDSSDLIPSPVLFFSALKDAFVVKLDPAATTLTFGTYLGGSQPDLATGIALDSNSNVYISGLTSSSGLATNSTFFAGVEDGFVAKFDTNLNEQFFTYVGGSGDDIANGIAVDVNSGVAYAVGRTQSVDLPLPGTPFQSAPKGLQDAFVAKINTDGTIAATTLLGGTGNADDGLAIALDSSDNVYVTGSTDSFDFPLQNAIPGLTALQGPNDGFVTELDSTLSTNEFSTYLGGNNSENENLPSSPSPTAGISVGSSGTICVTGSSNSTTGIPGVQNSNGGGTSDAFVAKIVP